MKIAPRFCTSAALAACWKQSEMCTLPPSRTSAGAVASALRTAVGLSRHSTGTTTSPLPQPTSSAAAVTAVPRPRPRMARSYLQDAPSLPITRVVPGRETDLSGLEEIKDDQPDPTRLGSYARTRTKAGRHPLLHALR